MSEMDIIENENDCSNDLLLLDRVFLRLGNADSDEKLENSLGRFLPPVILKLSSPHEQVRTKVMELLVHINKRVKCRTDVQLPVSSLLLQYEDPNANSFVTNFSIIYITMGYPRLPKDQQLSIAPTLLNAIENKPQGHQDGILMLLMPVLGQINNEDLKLKEKPKLSNLIIKFATDILLLPYRALPSNTDEQEKFQVPPGMTLKTYKRLVDKNLMTVNQLEEVKMSVMNFLEKDLFNDNDILLPLIIAAADSRFSIANIANSPLIRVANSVDWSSASVLSPLYSLYLGTWGGTKVPAADRKVAACTRLRLKLINYLNKSTGSGIMFPHCVQVVFSSLFDANSHSRLRNLALVYLLNVIQNGDETQLNKVATVFLQGLLKLIRSEEYAEHHAKAYMCLGRLAAKCPECINNQFSLLEELVKKVPEAAPEMKTALRDSLLEMSVAYRINTKSSKTSASDTPGSSNNLEKMDVDEQVTETKEMDPQSMALFALLDHYIHSEDTMIRYIAMRYASAVFPSNYMPSRYLLLLASGDSQDDISTEALRGLYGKSRPNEIEDVVNNVTEKDQNVVNIDNDTKDNRSNDKKSEFQLPNFKDMVNYIWDQIQRRKLGSNPKHRFVVNNQVLQFHPQTYQEILRYLHMCLNYEAGLKDCSNHPNTNSPLLNKYISENLLETEVLERYLTMITTLLAASSDLMSLTSFLNILGCAPEKIATKYKDLLPFFKNIFINSTKEDLREVSSVIYAIIFVSTGEKAVLDKEIKEFVEQAINNKNLESQCGYVAAFANLCERCINLSKKKRFGGKGFSPVNWDPYRAGSLCLVNFLTSTTPTVLISTSCTNIALLSRIVSLPLPDSTPEQESKIKSDNPYGTENALSESDGQVSKFTVTDRLMKLVTNTKVTSRIKEKSIYALGALCCGERFPFAKHIIKGFLHLAKDSKEFEIHLQIGESLVMCVEGVNSNENRDLWTELSVQGIDKVKDKIALEENDVILTWLLEELFILGKVTHPHSRQATSLWLLALLKNCPERQPILNKLQELQNMFMDFLSENSDIVQDVASKGLSLVYQNSDVTQQKALVAQIIEQLTSGKRAVAQVTEDTKVFEEGQLGKTPTGGNLSTYKEICSLASDLDQPELLYKLMHLAHHNSVWNSKKGAAFGFHSIALQAGEQLTEHLPKIIPRLYRYRFDPTPRIQNSMSSIWHALVPETTKTVHKYHKEILNDLVLNLTSPQWRVRISCCGGLAELLRGAASLHDSLEQLPHLWKQLFRVMDDVHEGTRQSASNTASVLSKLCVRASDTKSGKDGKEIVSVILPVLLETGITNIVREVRNVSLLTVSKLVSAAGEGLKPFLPNLIPALVTAAGDLESSKLSHLSTMLGNDTGSREVLDEIRATAAKHHYTTDTVVKCTPYIDIQVMTDMLPKMLELTKSPQLGTRVSCCHFFILATHNLRHDLEPIAGKIMINLLNGTLDRNPIVRKNYAEALGQVSAYAKSTSAEKLMKKLINIYESKDDEVTRSAVAYVLKALSKAKIELIKDNETIIAPTVFLAMHAPKDEEKATVEMFEEIWIDISPGRDTGIKEHMDIICDHIEQALGSRSWTKKTQAANAIQTVCKCSTPSTARGRLVRAVLAAIVGKTYDGKHTLLDALALLCKAEEGSVGIGEALSEECVRALVGECRKPQPLHRRHAIVALGNTLAALNVDRFHEVYQIVKGILVKDESSVNKDSDDDDTENARVRREQVIALKEAAYELLGKAWPRNPETQEKYQEVFFEHCSQSFASSTRATQLAILTAMSRVAEQLAVLKGGESMEVDNEVSNREAVVNKITSYVAEVIDYTLKNSNQVRHRREALNLLDIFAKQLKELNYASDFDKLKTIYQTYGADLSKDSSHELRAKVDLIKVHFK